MTSSIYFDHLCYNYSHLKAKCIRSQKNSRLLIWISCNLNAIIGKSFSKCVNIFGWMNRLIWMEAFSIFQQESIQCKLHFGIGI